MKETFATRLKYLREEKGLSQSQLSRKLNGTISQAAISAWELNQRIPTLDYLFILADFFDVSLDYLTGREN